MKKLLFLLLLAAAAHAQPTPCVQGSAPVTGGIALYLPFNNQCNYGYYLNQNSIKIAALFPLAKSLGGNGTATPALIAGTNITITGSWPNYTINASGGAAVWGAITGTLSSQTDLQNALNLKADATALALKAALASPAFTGNPTAPTATLGDNSTSIATTAFVQANSTGGGPVAPCGNSGDIQYNNSGNCGGLPATGTGAVARAVNPNISGLTLTDVIGLTQCLQTDASGHTSGTGLPCGTGGGGGPASIKSMSSYASAQVALNSITAGQTLLVDGTFTLCNGTITTSNFVLKGGGFQSGILQCGTNNVPVLTATGNGFSVDAVKMQHTISPVAGGDGLVVGSGTTGVHVSNSLFIHNYNGLNLGATSFGVIEGNYITDNNGDGVHFSPDASIPVMQWELVANLSQKNLGDCFDMTLPGSFSGVHNTGPTFLGDQAYGCAGYGYRFDTGSSTSSGISDVFIGAGTFSSTTNNSGFYFNNGSNGGRNVVVVGGFSELAGTYDGSAGYAGTAQTPTNVGHGIEITSACDATQPPTVSGMLMWENSFSGVITACAGTTLNQISAFKSGMALSGNSYERAGVAIRATNVGVIGGYMRNSGGTQIYGVDVSNSADTPNVVGVVCDSSTTTCINTSTTPANGFQSSVGNRRIINGSGVPGMSCSNGDEYHRYDAGNFSTLYFCKNAAWGAVN